MIGIATLLDLSAPEQSLTKIQTHGHLVPNMALTRDTWAHPWARPHLNSQTNLCSKNAHYHSCY